MKEPVKELLQFLYRDVRYSRFVLPERSAYGNNVVYFIPFKGTSAFLQVDDAYEGIVGCSFFIGYMSRISVFSVFYPGYRAGNADVLGGFLRSSRLCFGTFTCRGGI